MFAFRVQSPPHTALCHAGCLYMPFAFWVSCPPRKLYLLHYTYGLFQKNFLQNLTKSPFLHQSHKMLKFLGASFYRLLQCLLLFGSYIFAPAISFSVLRYQPLLVFWRIQWRDSQIFSCTCLRCPSLGGNVETEFLQIVKALRCIYESINNLSFLIGILCSHSVNVWQYISLYLWGF